MRPCTPCQELAVLTNEQIKGEMYEKTSFTSIGSDRLALVPMKQADAQVSVGIGPVGIGFGYPSYGYSYYGYPR